MRFVKATNGFHPWDQFNVVDGDDQQKNSGHPWKNVLSPLTRRCLHKTVEAFDEQLDYTGNAAEEQVVTSRGSLYRNGNKKQQYIGDESRYERIGDEQWAKNWKIYRTEDGFRRDLDMR
jgi:hypothetical protein